MGKVFWKIIVVGDISFCKWGCIIIIEMHFKWYDWWLFVDVVLCVVVLGWRMYFNLCLVLIEIWLRWDCDNIFRRIEFLSCLTECVWSCTYNTGVVFPDLLEVLEWCSEWYYILLRLILLEEITSCRYIISYYSYI